jgi:transposase-like protein
MNNGEKKTTEVLGTRWTRPRQDEVKQREPQPDEERDKPLALKNHKDVADPQVNESPERRRFTVEYKARIVREADACTEHGQIGALLRGEGLFSSQLAQWRKAYQRGALAALRDEKRGRKHTKHPLETENERLKKKNTQLEQRLSQAEVIIDIQKKLSQILRCNQSSDESTGNE